jgi:hypothetical protein
MNRTMTIQEDDSLKESSFNNQQINPIKNQKLQF